MQLPSGRARRSWWTYLSLTLASALIGHLVFDAVDDGVIAVVTRPIHLVYLLIVLGAFGAAAVDLYWHQPSERRRRIALMRAGLCNNGRTLMAVSLVTQVAFAATTILIENAVVDGSQLAGSALCALFALLLGTFALRRVESAILRLVNAAFITRRPQEPLRPKLFSLAVASSHELTYCLFRPNRPPPTFA